ncbi:DUF4406 domain-containing protein [Pseudomonas sp. BIGb0164]|uniref:DUF4406 domain-containing protein n=1 Tax=Pseudomonas sp. BIGb0164 TaxID=2940605 RepID=UPI0021698E16|nr:DUF4406 domain-containing protein [Pseudomonas sp. BIGb0164]MCS4250647.1 hypothetical protein [Pseudomonas sp. BIGb0164]
MPTENRKPDIRSIVTDSLVSMVAAVTRTTPPANEPLPSFIQAPVDRAVDRIKSFLLPGVTLQTARANRVYVAGPMTGIADFNYPAFNAVADQLRAQGYEVENPADRGIVEGAQWAEYIAYDLTRLGLCGVIALLPDWEKSQGAKLEVLIAERLGMTVVNSGDLVTREAV